MPFDAELNEMYAAFLVPILSDAGFEVHRADDIGNQRNILRDIVESIAQADLIVADLTGLNANVFYELGVAHALSKRVVLMTQNIDEVPFDLRSYRIVPYDTHFARIESARATLRETAGGAFSGTVEFGNPVTDFLRTSGKDLLDVVGPQGDTADKPPPMSEENEERGWLDHLEALVVGTSRLTEILGDITTATVQIGAETTRYAELMQRAQSSSEPNVPTRVRFLASEYARILAEYGQRLATSNENYEVVARESEDSIEFVIQHGRLPDPEAIAKLEEFVITLRRAENVASVARGNYVEMRNTLKGLEGIEKGLTRAAKVVGREVDRLVDNVDKTIASLHRGIEVGARRVEEERKQLEKD